MSLPKADTTRKRGPGETVLLYRDTTRDVRLRLKIPHCGEFRRRGADVGRRPTPDHTSLSRRRAHAQRHWQIERRLEIDAIAMLEAAIAQRIDGCVVLIVTADGREREHSRLLGCVGRLRPASVRAKAGGESELSDSSVHALTGCAGECQMVSYQSRWSHANHDKGSLTAAAWIGLSH